MPMRPDQHPGLRLSSGQLWSGAKNKSTDMLGINGKISEIDTNVFLNAILRVCAGGMHAP